MLPKRPILTKYTYDAQQYSKWTTNHRRHQKEATRAMRRIYNNDNKIGQVILPTGTGKTRCQVDAQLFSMLKEQQLFENYKTKGKHYELGTYVIMAHRLSLCTQLIDDIMEVVVSVGLHFNILYVGSDKYDEGDLADRHKDCGLDSRVFKVLSTTREKEVTKFAEDTRKAGRHLIIVSTYHSCVKLKGVGKIDVCTYDEAHTVASNSMFYKNILEIKPQMLVEYFFTATRCVYDEMDSDIRGMNNEEFFGKVIYSKSPREMIKAGEMVGVLMHEVKPTIDDLDVAKFEHTTMRSFVVTDSFRQHRIELRNNNNNPSVNIGAKLLVSFNGTDDMLEVMRCNSFKQYTTKNNIKVVSFSSRSDELCTVNGNKCGKAVALNYLRSLSEEDDAMLFHIDMLAEGIDLPTVTAVLPFRALSNHKLIQTVGRATRLVSTDRMNFYSGKNKPNEVEKMVKPYCYVIVPTLIFDEDSRSETVNSIISTVLTEFGLCDYKLSGGGKFNGEVETVADNITDGDKTIKEGKCCELKHSIYSIWGSMVGLDLLNIDDLGVLCETYSVV
jgi:superfamily II DNA or RNA helicase